MRRQPSQWPASTWAANPLRIRCLRRTGWRMQSAKLSPRSSALFPRLIPERSDDVAPRKDSFWAITSLVTLIACESPSQCKGRGSTHSFFDPFLIAAEVACLAVTEARDTESGTVAGATDDASADNAR